MIPHILKNIKQVAVFDTAFHQTIPDYAYMYALPYSLYKKHKIRKYGFHGTSHQYVSKRGCQILKLNFEKQKIITCHLGNGASMAAIDQGKVIDTSMGMTPLEGLIMGTRPGDTDPGALIYLMQKEKLNAEKLNELLNKKSGILGVTEISSDLRDVKNAAWNKNNKKAKLALEMYYYRIKKYIGAYTAAMNGLDILIFTGGVGENAPRIRQEILKNLDYLGIQTDTKLNEKIIGKESTINKKGSKVKILVIPTNEELVIAEETEKILFYIKI